MLWRKRFSEMSQPQRRDMLKTLESDLSYYEIGPDKYRKVGK